MNIPKGFLVTLLASNLNISHGAPITNPTNMKNGQGDLGSFGNWEKSECSVTDLAVFQADWTDGLFFFNPKNK